MGGGGCLGIMVLLQAAHVLKPVLSENGGQIGFGDIVRKGAVSEDNARLARRSQFLVPGDNAWKKGAHSTGL